MSTGGGVASGDGAGWDSGGRVGASPAGPVLSRSYLAAMAGLVILLAGAAWLAYRYLPPSQQGLAQPTLSIHSSGQNGARALRLWLADLGYRTASIEHRRFAIDPQVRLLFVLAPGNDLMEQHAAGVAGWVEGGGTLVLATDRSNPLLDRLGVEVETGDRLGRAVPRQPLFLDPPLREVEVDTSVRLRLLRPEWVPLLGGPGAGGGLVGAVARLGQGQAFVLVDTHALSNSGLGHADNWALVMHLVSRVPAGAAIAFDEYHHGLTERGTLGMHLLREPWGWAILFAAAVLFAYVALAGRRFGRAASPVLMGSRRSRVEYVVTLAGLLRQGKHHRWLRDQYVGQVKRALGSRYRVRSDLPSAEFLAVLAAQRPEAAAMAGPLGRLEGDEPLEESAVVASMLDVERLRNQLLGGG